MKLISRILVKLLEKGQIFGKPQSLEFSDLSVEFSMQTSAQFSVSCLIWVDKGVTHVFQAALNLVN